MDGLTRRVPAGYSAIDLFPGGDSGRGSGGLPVPPLRVCVLVRDEPEPAGGRLVVVRDVMDASASLGCVLDASGAVDAWIEVWVQRVDTLDASRWGGRAEVSNASLEARWDRTVEGLAASAPDLVIRTGLETAPPPACGLDLKRGVVRAPVHEPSGGCWDVCRDEDVLAAKGLPSFRSSLARHLWVPGLGEGTPFVDASDGEAVRREILTGVNRDLVPFNLQGGLLMVRRLAPIGYAEYADVVGGRSWSGVRHGVSAIDLREGHESVGRAPGFGGDPEPVDPDRLFLGRQGRGGRLVEALHLKVKMLAEAVAAVRVAVERTGRPLLNVTDESFRVELWEGGIGLPRLWTSRVRLVDPGTAHAVTVGGAAGFVSPDGVGRGVYRPVAGGEGVGGRCDFRIRSIDRGDPSGVVIEATFRTDARVGGSAGGSGSDLLELRVPLDGDRLLIHGRVRPDDGLGRGEMRFRSEPCAVSGAVSEALDAAEGVPMRDVSFEGVPLASTPCDLHALGVLGVRTLLVDGGNTLAAALDDLLSLSRAAESLRVGEPGREGEPGLSLAEAVERVFCGDERWPLAVGPQRLIGEDVPVGLAVDLVPTEIWVRVLALLSRMLLGATGDGYCRSASGMRGVAPHVVFEGAAEGLASLLVRTRSLIVVDWRHNREVHAVLRGYREGMAAAD